MARNLSDLEAELSVMNKQVAEIEKRAELSLIEAQINDLHRKKNDIEKSMVTSTPVTEKPFDSDRDSGFGATRRSRKLPLIPIKQNSTISTPHIQLGDDNKGARPKTKAVTGLDVGGLEVATTPRKSNNFVKPATYDGTGPWVDYLTHFKACAEINRWSHKEKGLYLAVSLRGQAQGVLGNLSGISNDYDTLVRNLEERFAPSNQTELYRAQLRDKRQKASESLPELGQEIRRLTNLAYPTAPNDVKET